MTIDPQVLQRLPLFAALPEAELRLLAGQLRPVQFADGALVLREGENCDEFFVVFAGEVAIIKSLDTPDERLLAVRAAGTVVGELSLFTPGGRHTASVRAQGPVEMLVMTRADFDRLLASEPRLAYGMVQTLSLRLIESEQTIIRDLREKNAALADALRSLQAAQAQLVEKEKLERELEVARRIQCTLLCSAVPRLPGCDLGALTEAMSAVGGDFYDFITYPDGRLGLAIGDVADHGVAAALFGSMTMTLLRSAARRAADQGVADPAEVLRAVNRGLLEFDLSSMFVTVLYGVLDPRRREFHYARAGHEPPLLRLSGAAAGRAAAPPPGAPRAADESGMWVVDPSVWAAASKAHVEKPARRGKRPGVLQRDDRRPKDEGAPRETGAPPPAAVAPPPALFKRGQALGLLPNPELDEQSLALPPHSTLLLYTDGAREAWDPLGNMFGDQGLRAVLAETEKLPAEKICDRIVARVAAHRGPVPQQDDITLMVARLG
jgi:serine phosphatase RsbU (regulator of sigma subunit)